ncbi:MAG: phenylalanine--tRNA ligase subunit beta [Candidatus Zixiibacteriota bacterium]
MKIPYSWLQEITGVSWSADVMMDRLSRSGTGGNLERYDPAHFANVVTGKIVKLEPHPNADKLRVAQVDTGKKTWSVICGAPNAEVGQIVPLALPGAKLKGEFEIKEMTMRGVQSSGMICAEDELGLSDDHSGIMVFDDSTPLNQPVFDVLGLGDPVLDLEVTPNRPDSLCANGLAREISVLADIQIDLTKDAPKESSEKASDYISVKIDDADACPRYAARIIRNVKIGPSPEWMQKRLTACGVRPINNIVDIGNYVMLETNQPLHAFDYDRFGSKEVVVRRAKKGDTFTTLDGKKHDIDSDILMITNGKQHVATAGVMGGLDSEVEDDTVNILLESAHFNASVIRKSRNKLGYNTEASFRFERGVDPGGVIAAADRAAALMAELAGGEVLAGVVDTYAKKIEKAKVTLRPERVCKLLGVEIDRETIKKILTGLGMEISGDGVFAVTVPTWRPDITREVDLIEEVARIYGLDNIPNGKNNKGPLYTPTHRRDTIRADLRNILNGFGFDEMMGTGFAKPKMMLLLEPSIEPIKVTNPISDDFGYMRTRMLYSMLIAASHNIRHRNLDVRLFEIGKVYLRHEDMPLEPEYCGLILSGKTGEMFWKDAPVDTDLFELKGALDGIADGVGIGTVELVLDKKSGYDSSGSYKVVCGDKTIGWAGKVDRKLLKTFDIKQDCYAAELQIAEMIRAEKGVVLFESLPKFPSSTRDIAIIVDKSVTSGMLKKVIIENGGDILDSVTVFDVFTGGNISEDKKSLAFSLIFRSSDKTLADNEVDAVHQRIIKALETSYQARLRE